MNERIEEVLAADLRDELVGELQTFNPQWTYKEAGVAFDALLDVLEYRMQDWWDAAATWEYNNRDSEFLVRLKEPLIEALRGLGECKERKNG